MKKIVMGVLIFLGLLIFVQNLSWAEIKKLKKKEFVCKTVTGAKPASANSEIKTTGNYNVAFFLIAPQDQSFPDWGPDELKPIFLEHKYSPKSFFDENSKGKLNLSGQFFGWRKLPNNSDYYYDEDSEEWISSDIAYDAVELFDNEVDYREFDVVFLIFAHNDYYDVMARTYKSHFSTNDGDVYLSLIWTGRTLYEGYEEEGKFVSGDKLIRQICSHITHEFGHTLGLNHANRWVPYSVEGCRSCANLKKPEDSTDCKIAAYGGWDVMGTRYYNFPFFSKIKLGWMDAKEVIEVKNSQTLWLKHRNADSGDRYVRIPVGLNNDGEMAYVPIEYTSNTGTFDSFIGYDFYTSYDSIDSNVLLISYYPNGQRIDDDQNGSDGDYLTYMQVKDGQEWDTAYSFPILYGSRTVWCDPKRGLTVEVKEETGDTPEDAQVQLQITIDCPREPYYVSASISMEASPSGTQTVHAGESLDYQLTLATKDFIGTGLDCDPISYSFAVSAPEGWNVQLSSRSADLKTGESAMTNLSVSVPYGTEARDYEITVKATDSTDYLNAELKIVVSVLRQANYAIFSSNESVSKIKRGGIISRSVYISDENMGKIVEEENIQLTCQLIKPNGASEEIEAEESGNRFYLSYPVKNNDPLGTYTFKLTATVAEREHTDAWTGEKELKFKVIKNKKGKKIAILVE